MVINIFAHCKLHSFVYKEKLCKYAINTSSLEESWKATYGNKKKYNLDYADGLGDRWRDVGSKL